MTLPAEGTVLVLSGMGVTLYSARGLSQTLTPIAEATALERSVNGEMLDFSDDQFRLYASKITCTDQNTPAIDGIWPGVRITVNCVAEISYPTSGGSPSRAVITDPDSDPPSPRTEGDFTFYRPQLEMTVMGFNTLTDEWGASVGWELDLEETGGEDVTG